MIYGPQHLNDFRQIRRIKESVVRFVEIGFFSSSAEQETNETKWTERSRRRSITQPSAAVVLWPLHVYQENKYRSTISLLPLPVPPSLFIALVATATNLIAAAGPTAEEVWWVSQFGRRARRLVSVSDTSADQFIYQSKLFNSRDSFVMQICEVRTDRALYSSLLPSVHKCIHLHASPHVRCPLQRRPRYFVLYIILVGLPILHLPLHRFLGPYESVGN